MSEATDLVPIEHDFNPPAFWTQEQIDLIKSTVAKGTTDNEFSLFLYVCKKTGLDPLARQIYAIKRWNNVEKREIMAIQTGIDGFRLVAARTREHAGTDDVMFETEPGKPYPTKATITVYRLVQGSRFPFTASARWSEYVQTTKEGLPNSMWSRMPYVMLSKCVEALALRKAFPAELSGVYAHEEMMQADNEDHSQIIADPSLREIPKQKESSTFAAKEPKPEVKEEEKREPLTGKDAPWIKAVFKGGMKGGTIEGKKVPHRIAVQTKVGEQEIVFFSRPEPLKKYDDWSALVNCKCEVKIALVTRGENTYKNLLDFKLIEEPKVPEAAVSSKPEEDDIPF